MGKELPKPEVRSEANVRPVVERHSNWLSEPPRDPNLLRIFNRVRWEFAAVTVLIGAGWLALGIVTLVRQSSLVGLLSPLILVSIAVWHRVRTNTASPSVEDLLDLPAVVDQYPVRVVYRSDATAFGYDEGIVSTLDGWLHFQGRRTTFSVFHSDVSHRRGEIAVQQPSDRRTHILGWRVNGVVYSVDLEPFDQTKMLGKGLAGKLQTAFWKWNDCGLKKQGESIWPPRTPMPGLVRRLEQSFVFWSTFKWACTAAFLVGICACVLGAKFRFIYGVAIVSVIVCTVAESNLKRIASSLRNIGRGCEGGNEVVQFEKVRGPFWKRIDRPSVS